MIIHADPLGLIYLRYPNLGSNIHVDEDNLIALKAQQLFCCSPVAF